MVAMFCKMVREPYKFCYIQVGCGSYVRKRKMNLVFYIDFCSLCSVVMHVMVNTMTSMLKLGLSRNILILTMSVKLR